MISSRLPLPMGRHISEVHPQRIKLKQRKEISCADLEKMVQSGTATDARPHLGLAGPRFHTQDSVSPLHGLKTIRATEICDSPLKMNNQKHNRRLTNNGHALVIDSTLESISRPTNILFLRTRTSKIGGAA